MSLHINERYGLLINNEWVPASDGAEFNVYNPANGEQLAICAEATKDDVDRAVAAATEAFKTWKNVSQVDRADYLLKIADAIDAHKEHLAQVETYDNGKPIRETLNVDIPYGADHFRSRSSSTLELPVPNGCLETGTSSCSRLYSCYQTI